MSVGIEFDHKSPRMYPISCQAFAFPVNLSRVQWNYVKST